MPWISKNAEFLIAICAGQSNKEAKIQTVVVGSGYGAAVAALRFAEHGQQVYVLERGNEYVAGEFPNDISQLGEHLRSEIASESGVSLQGYEKGLFDFRVGLRAGALVGNGLGGGSLINAAVGVQPDPRVFKLDEWPAALRNETQEALDKWFDLAGRMHELQIPGAPACGKTQPIDFKRTDKYMRMQDMRSTDFLWKKRPKEDKDIVISFESTPLAIQLDTPTTGDPEHRRSCVGCGDCVTGCNHNAKLSLDATYLPKAFKAGAQLFTGVSVLHVAKDEEGNLDFPWVVYFVRTDERKQQHEIEQHSPQPPAASEGWVYKLRARHVVLGAGAFGSTEILLRSRAKGLPLSNTALGMGVSGNGDDVSCGYDLKHPANAVGNGSKAASTTVVGPTISGMLRFTDPHRVKRGTLLQDGAIPGLLQAMAHELLTGAGALAQMGNWRFRNYSAQDPLVLQPKALGHSLTVLGMGHDSAGGVMVFDTKADRIKWGWPKAAEETTPDLHKSRVKGCVEELGGIYIQNPAVNALPDAVGSALTGPKPGGMVFTVHPLGGCRMSDSPLTGVVNHWGAVWNENGALHDGLYVLDGSTMPSALGANPMLTITALAERACSMILQGVTKKPLRDTTLPAYPPTVKPHLMAEGEESQPSTRMAEVLRGKMIIAAGTLPPSTNNFFKDASTLDAALFLEFDVPSWPAFFADKNHTVAIAPNTDPHGTAYTRSRLVLNHKNAPKPLELVVVSGFAHFCRQQKRCWLAQASSYLRAALTYWYGRWSPDKQKYPSAFSINKLLRYGAKLIAHANHSREFHYEIKLTDQTNFYLLTGTKKIEAAASWRSLLAWLNTRLTTYTWPAPARPSVWQQLTQLPITLSSCTPTGSWVDPKPLATARLVMDLPDMLRRVKPQLGLNRDNITGLLGLAGYPLFLLRVILQTRLLDFRAPDYKKDLFESDPAITAKPPGYFELDGVAYPDIPATAGGMPTKAEIQAPLMVPLTWPKQKGVEPELVRIGLVRYRAENLHKSTVDGLHRVKSIILINGFLLSTQSFVAEELNELGGNLASQLHAAGWDVWMLEYRASPLLDVSALDSNMDDIAAFDIPRAVDRVIDTVSQELGLELEETQIFAYSRCVGSGALSMSLLSGFLRRPGGTNKLAGVQLSDFHPFLVGSVSAQLRLQVAAFLSGVLNLKYVQFTAGNTKSDLLHALMDRIFSSVDYAYADEGRQRYLHEIDNERCPHEDDLRKHQPDSTTCKRITGLMSRSYRHAQLLPKTHDKLDFYFGRGNIGVFLQGAKCVTQERLVTSDGLNAYVTDENIQSYMNMPLFLTHGKYNALFDVESFERSKGQFQRLLPTAATGIKNRFLRFDNFGHVDLILGKDAPKEVTPKVVKFFNAALYAPTPRPAPVNNRCRARMARTGPIVGWVRPDPKDADVTLIRVWIEVDDTHADRAMNALTIVEFNGHELAQVWPIKGKKLKPLAMRNQAGAGVPMNKPPNSKVFYAVADIAVPTEHINEVTIQMVSIHVYAGPPLTAGSYDHLGLPPEWGAPMHWKDVGGPGKKTPLFIGLGGVAAAAAPLVAMAPANPVPYGQSVTPGQNARLLPTSTLTPGADIKSLIDPLKHDLKQARITAYSANPNTLSRQNRSLRSYRQRTLQLSREQLQDTADGNLIFYAAGCRHPGLTGFETQRANDSLRMALEAIDTSQPRFMLMLGDQIYADVRAGVIDTESPIEKLLSRYHEAFGKSDSFRKLAKRLPMYMVMDDHEINDNWSAEQVLQSNLNAVLAENAKAAFTIYQYAHGPGLPADLQNPKAQVQGFNYCYEHNQIPFLVLDTRSQRTRVPQRRILHSSQWRWLEGWLLEQQKQKGACPKFIVSGSVIAPGLIENTGNPSPRGADTWQMCAGDRNRLLSFVADSEIDNVVFLSNDYHCSAAAEIRFTHSAVKAWAIVAPPLHAPMPFANVEASEVCSQERIPLARGTATVNSTAWDGEGWLTCKVSRAPLNRFCLNLIFHLRQADKQDWRPKTYPTRTWHL